MNPTGIKHSILAVFLSLTSLVSAGTLSKDLQNVTTTTDVIVQFNSTPTTTMISAVTMPGGSLKKKFNKVPGASFSLPPTAIAALISNPNVRYASADRKVKGTLEFAQPTTKANLALAAGYDGGTVGVAVIDSGINASADLSASAKNSGRVIYNESFVPNDSSTADAYGHGTHVAGIIGGNGANSSTNAIYTFRGIAPNVNIINLRVLDAAGAGTDSAIIAAIEQAIALKATYNIRVINLSLGRQVFESYTLDPLCQAVEKAWNAGIVVVVAAGNNGRNNSMGTNGYATIASPGNDPFAITVGAMKDGGTVDRSDDLMASYSSKGPSLYDHVVKPDLVAPGNRIISAFASNSAIETKYPTNIVPVSYYKSTSSTQTSSTYFTLSGTSMAAPMVSGAAALLIQKDATLTPDTVKARLMKSASKTFPTSSSVTDTATGLVYTTYYDLFTVGAGYLDVWEALNNQDTLPAGYSAKSQTVSYNATTNTTSVVNGTSVVWGVNVVWGENVVWGSNVVWGDNVVWGSNVVWGDSTAVGFNVVWGANVVWGDSQPYSEALSVTGEK